MKRTFLFLQGPICSFFSDIAQRLLDEGHAVHRINLCFGDALFWRHPNAVCYRDTLENWPAFIDDYFQTHNITDVLMLGEQRAYHKAAAISARRHGAQIVATDFGYLRPDWITFEQNGMSRDSLFPRDPDKIRALAAQCPAIDHQRRYRDSFFNQAVWDMKYHFGLLLMSWRYPHYDSHQIYHPIAVYLGTGWRMFLRQFRTPAANRLRARLVSTNTRYFVFPLQIENDFQLREYSPFDSLTDAITDVLQNFSQHAPRDTKLVIKVHPLDPSQRNWQLRCRAIARKFKIESRVHYIDGGSLNDLIDTSAGVVTINSTVGIWTLNHHTPLKVLGDAIYDIEGLTDQQPLDSFWQQPQIPDSELCNAFMRAMAGCIQLRGVYYNQPGLRDAVAQATHRLLNQQVNQPFLPQAPPESDR